MFIAIKAYEWISEIQGDQTITSSDFFMYYYMLTGVHLFHVLQTLSPHTADLDTRAKTAGRYAEQMTGPMLAFVAAALEKEARRLM